MKDALGFPLFFFVLAQVSATAILAGLELTERLAWGWGWATSPLWMPPALLIGVALLVALGVLAGLAVAGMRHALRRLLYGPQDWASRARRLAAEIDRRPQAMGETPVTQGRAGE